jgi:hypothetical protein
MKEAGGRMREAEPKARGMHDKDSQPLSRMQTAEPRMKKAGDRRKNGRPKPVSQRPWNSARTGRWSLREIASGRSG